MFETAYPYIGLSNDTYEKVATILERDIEGMECIKGSHWGICRVKEQMCDQVNFEIDLTVIIQDYEFTIPLDNMATYVNMSGTFYCQTQIALLPKTENSVILGGAFFTSFLGIFDVENERIGLAESSRALPGSSIKCTGATCRPVHAVKPKSQTRDIPNTLVYIVIVSIITGLLVCGIISWCRYKKRAERNKTG